MLQYRGYLPMLKSLLHRSLLQGSFSSYRGLFYYHEGSELDLLLANQISFYFEQNFFSFANLFYCERGPRFSFTSLCLFKPLIHQFLFLVELDLQSNLETCLLLSYDQQFTFSCDFQLQWTSFVSLCLNQLRKHRVTHLNSNCIVYSFKIDFPISQHCKLIFSAEVFLIYFRFPMLFLRILFYAGSG